MSDAPFASLQLERRGPVAEVTLTGPGKGNAMGPDFWRELPALFGQLDRDAAVHAVILRGSGGNFSYGLDLRAMAMDLGSHLFGEQLAAGRTALLETIHRLQGAITSVAACRKPVVAAVTGWCIGGGLDLASACDIRFASSDARFSLREAKVAMVADIGSLQRLPAIIGEGATRELAFTAKDIGADQALRIGLVSQVLDNEDALLASARETATQIAANPALVVQGIKRVMNHAVDDRVRAGLEHVALWNAAFLQSKDLAEAFAAFAERRAPVYKGE